MRAVVQRVSRASVKVDDAVVGEIAGGLLVLLGVSQQDQQSDADYLAEKIVGLRVFNMDVDDDKKKMNRSVAETAGGILVVSQFTLYGDGRRGRRPSFDAAARPEQAQQLYEHFVERIRAAGVHCETGKFQAMMEVELVNDGPVTILLDSEKVFDSPRRKMRKQRQKALTTEDAEESKGRRIKVKIKNKDTALICSEQRRQELCRWG